ncbi:MAG: hypothetical protein D6818_01005, partial [Bacteroidetes bacterium]
HTALRFLLFVSMLWLSACSEIPPVIPEPTGPTGTNDLENQQRQVLIEEFTGVRCVNCPAGSAFIQDLLALHGPRLVAVSIHAGEFSYPYNDSQYNFQTPEGDQILNYVGQPFGYPSAVIDRKLFDGEATLQVGKGSWAGYIEQEKAHPPRVKIGLAADWQAAARQLAVDVTVLAADNVSADDIRLTVLLTEDGVVDVQETPDGKDPNYVHKHVFRTTLTPALGESLGPALTAGQTLNRSYTFTMPDLWVAENCHVVAFVHLDGASKEVLQAHQVAVVE